MQQIEYGIEAFGRLRSVLVHTPGPELAMLTPSNYKKLQFDAVPNVEAFIAEHSAYCSLLKEHGVVVYQLRDYVKKNKERMLTLPNLMYLHDTAVVTRHGAILSAMRWCRSGEELVVSEALHNLRIKTAIEFGFGSDVFEGCLALSPTTLIVAYTERHSFETIKKFINAASEHFKEIVVADVPKARRFMHADTVFGRVAEDLVLVYPPAFRDTTLYSNRRAKKIDFLEFLKRKGIMAISVTEAEQLRLACSFVALEPRKIIHYDTALAPATLGILEREGVESILFHPIAMKAGGGSLRCLTMRLHRN